MGHFDATGRSAGGGACLVTCPVALGLWCLLWLFRGVWVRCVVAQPGGGASRVVGVRVVGVLNGSGPNLWLGPEPNVCPAVSYSPTPSRVQYHRRCGS